MKKWILRASVLALAATACKKGGLESTLPAATQDGRNTAGWLADGTPHVASNFDGDLFVSPMQGVSGGVGPDGAVGISFTGFKDPLKPSVGLYFRAHQPGIYELNGRNFVRPGNPSMASYQHNASPNSIRYVTTAQYVGNYTGRVVLTRCDLRSGAVAGTFEFRAVSPLDTTKSITITSGRFDCGSN